jgi:hypothetical protein
MQTSLLLMLAVFCWLTLLFMAREAKEAREVALTLSGWSCPVWLESKDRAATGWIKRRG